MGWLTVWTVKVALRSLYARLPLARKAMARRHCAAEDRHVPHPDAFLPFGRLPHERRTRAHRIPVRDVRRGEDSCKLDNTDALEDDCNADCPADGTHSRSLPGHRAG